MRMFTEVGRRAKPHTTAVGKAILANKPEADVLDLLKRTGMERRTDHTITTPADFLADLERIRARGYALDDGEQELGVRCVAVVVPDAPRPMALSMSGPLTRMTDEVVATAAPILHEAAAEIGAELGVPSRWTRRARPPPSPTRLPRSVPLGLHPPRPLYRARRGHIATALGANRRAPPELDTALTGPCDPANLSAE